MIIISLKQSTEAADVPPSCQGCCHHPDQAGRRVTGKGPESRAAQVRTQAGRNQKLRLLVFGYGMTNVTVRRALSKRHFNMHAFDEWPVEFM